MAHRKALAVASLVAVAGLAVLTPSTADARPRGRIRGGVVVGGFYDPFYYSPFYSPFGFGYGYGWGGYPYAAYGPYSPYAYGRGYDTSGSARIQVTPKDAEVYVDGYRAGRVDDFDGIFQRLHLDSGAHRIEVRITPEHTTTYQGELKKIQ